MYDARKQPLEENDRELQRRVVAYLADRNVPALRRLTVESRRGVVTLRGRVQTFYEKQVGGHAARRVAGVVSLIDDVQVVGGQTVSDPRSPRQLPARHAPSADVALRASAPVDRSLRVDAAGQPGTGLGGPAV